MVIVFALLALAATGLTLTVPTHFVDDRTHRFQGTIGGPCQKPGCGKPYASSVHHEQIPGRYR